MALTFNSKYSVTFEWDDSDVSSKVKLTPGDDQETLVRKLKRVIVLVEGEQVPPSGPRMTAFSTGMPVTVKAAEPPHLGPQQVANGWELLGPDDLDDAPGESG